MTRKSRRAGRASTTVLVVDGDDALRALVRRLLESRDYRVLDAGDAASAEQIAKVYVGPIHLLLVELELAGTSGAALVERLRGVHPEPAVVFMSADAKKDLVRRGRLEPRLPFLHKPFGADDLALALRGARGAPR